MRSLHDLLMSSFMNLKLWDYSHLTGVIFCVPLVHVQAYLLSLLLHLASCFDLIHRFNHFFPTSHCSQTSTLSNFIRDEEIHVLKD